MIEVPLNVAQISGYVRDILAANAVQNVNCPPTVSGPILKKVVEFCTQHATDPMVDQTSFRGDTLRDVFEQEWYADFINMDQDVLFSLIHAAYVMKIEPLLTLACVALSVLYITGKSTEELCQLFKIPVTYPTQTREKRIGGRRYLKRLRRRRNRERLSNFYQCLRKFICCRGCGRDTRRKFVS